MYKYKNARNYILFDIAGILFRAYKGKIEFSTDLFKNFIRQRKNPDSKTWSIKYLSVAKRKTYYRKRPALTKNLLHLKKRFAHIEELRKAWPGKRRLLYLLKIPRRYPAPCLGFLFNEPIFVDIKRRNITRFFLDGKTGGRKNKTDFQLIPYLYSQALALNKGLLLHATGVIKKGKAYLFFGISGSGKSTVARLSKRFKVLGDDMIAIRKKRGCYHAFCTPWAQADFVKPDRLTSCAIEAIFFIRKSKKICFRPIRKEKALADLLLEQTHFFMHTGTHVAEKMFFNACELIKESPVYEMKFTKDKDFWPRLDSCLKA